MKRTDEVNNFIESLKKGSLGHKLVKVIESDITLFDEAIINKILRGEFKMDGNWDAYVLNDVDVLYDKNMLKFNNRLDMFGIRGSVPPIRANDTGLIFIYRFTMFDIFGSELDSLAAYHVAIKQTNVSTIPVERFIVSYDQ